MSLPNMSPMQGPPQLDPVLGHNAISSVHAYYTDLVNYFLRTAQQQKLELEAQLANEKDAHAKTKLDLKAVQAKLDLKAVQAKLDDAQGIVASEPS